MAASNVSAAQHHAVSALGKRINHQIGVDHTGTHDANDTGVRRILNPGHSGKVRTGIGTPVAAEGDDQRFELVAHGSHFLSSSLQVTGDADLDKRGTFLNQLKDS